MRIAVVPYVGYVADAVGPTSVLGGVARVTAL